MHPHGLAQSEHKSPSSYPSACFIRRYGNTQRKVEHRVSRKMTACLDCLASIRKRLCLRRVNRGQSVRHSNAVLCDSIPGSLARDENASYHHSASKAVSNSDYKFLLLRRQHHLLSFSVGFWPMVRWCAPVVMWQRDLPCQKDRFHEPRLQQWSGSLGSSRSSMKPLPQTTACGCSEAWWQRPLEPLIAWCPSRSPVAGVVGSGS